MDKETYDNYLLIDIYDHFEEESVNIRVIINPIIHNDVSRQVYQQWSSIINDYIVILEDNRQDIEYRMADDIICSLYHPIYLKILCKEKNIAYDNNIRERYEEFKTLIKRLYNERNNQKYINLQNEIDSIVGRRWRPISIDPDLTDDVKEVRKMVIRRQVEDEKHNELERERNRMDLQFDNRIKRFRNFSFFWYFYM